MKKKVAFVLSGGGARGALQVGGLRALLEAGIYPDMIVGTSVGAVNAAFLAMHGVSVNTIDLLEQSWNDAVTADLLPSNYLWLILRALFKQPGHSVTHRMKDFFIAQGVGTDIEFGDTTFPFVFIVTTDLNSGCVQIYGENPKDKLLDAVLASTALPPWIAPLSMGDKYLMDGGILSPLPIQPAITLGASEIFALDVRDERVVPAETQGFGPFLGNVLYAIETRQVDLELALAASNRIRMTHIKLCGEHPVPIWDFSYTLDLIPQGYNQAKDILESAHKKKQIRGLNVIKNWLNRSR
jgi:NTE family protein